MTHTLSLNVNGQAHSKLIAPTKLLLSFLREDLGLTGSHSGCDTAQCGACTIHMDGQAVKACSMLALQAQGKSITTIEGLAQGDALHPMQEAFHLCHGLQCGFCTPGMVMSACSLLKQNSSPSDEQIRHALEGNICRCTGYENIVAAVRSVAGRATLSDTGDVNVKGAR